MVFVHLGALAVQLLELVKARFFIKLWLVSGLNLTAIVEASKAEYNSVVEELETVCELFEDARTRLFRHSRPGIIDDEANDWLQVRAARAHDRQTHPAAFGELHGIAAEVEQYLP